jgi:hypothetical protein
VTEPALAVPRTGPCSPWVSGADVEGRPWVQDAAAKLRKDGKLEAGQLEALCAEAAMGASAFLYEESGRIFSGSCGPVTVRPVERPIDGDSRSWGARLSPLGWFASWGLASSYGAQVPGVMSHYGSTEPPEITLPYPVRSIVEVTIDGITIPPAEYELRDFQTLVRMRPGEGERPTARYGWPTSQRQDLQLDQQGTFGVTFTFGNDPPPTGLIAARKLAEYLVVPQLGDGSKYPRRVTSITRQGVSAGITDIVNVMQKSGSTGIYEVDLFLRSVNPNKLQRQAAVWSPDIGRNRRTAPRT